MTEGRIGAALPERKEGSGVGGVEAGKERH